jgi:ParB/RepB/Spo0J family partition protein
MQNSSEFQYIAIDQLVESKTNPRKTFDQKKLEELAESIRSGGLIQPIVVRPKDNAFEIVAGARRFRAGQLAEQFSLPARIKSLEDCNRELKEQLEAAYGRLAVADPKAKTARRLHGNDVRPHVKR